MRFQTVIGTALALATHLVSAAPTNTYVYATFYDDNACTVNPGEAVSCSNPGCLNESGRNSIFFQGGALDYAIIMVISPSPNCPCQNGCVLNVAAGGPYCLNIDGTSDGPSGSFRFVGNDDGNCPSDNCPGT